MTADQPPALLVLRCERCGDTFTSEGGTEVACRSCGSSDVHPATEPLL